MHILYKKYVEAVLVFVFSFKASSAKLIAALCICAICLALVISVLPEGGSSLNVNKSEISGVLSKIDVKNEKGRLEFLSALGYTAEDGNVQKISEKLPDVLPGTSYYSVGMLVAAPPIVEDVEIEKVMNGLYRVSYSYKHPLGITEGKSKIQWYLDGNPAGTETSQEIGNGVSTIKVSITPIASQKPFEGTTVSATKTISKSYKIRHGII